MEQVTVTIGRRDNVNGLELSVAQWGRFRAEVVSQLEGRGFTVVVDNEGTGSWEGVTEPNFIAVGIRETAVTDAERTGLRTVCADLARRYDQDAIALSFGTSELIEASPEPFTAVAHGIVDTTETDDGHRTVPAFGPKCCPSCHDYPECYGCGRGEWK